MLFEDFTSKSIIELFPKFEVSGNGQALGINIKTAKKRKQVIGTVHNIRRMSFHLFISDF
jgi:hypothetical protein